MTTPKERPILFSGPMVRAILNGSKTQTRRIVKLPRGAQLENDAPEWANFGDRPLWWPWIDASEDDDGFLPCPYGQPGEQLWVKETFTPFEDAFIYRADWDVQCPNVPLNGCWKPSIFCTRLASRITLEVTKVRVERLQEISEADAIAEGVTIQDDARLTSLAINSKAGPAQLEYFALWESINGPGSWNANPFVWVIEFRRLTP